MISRRILKLNKSIQRSLMDYFLHKMKTKPAGVICVKEVCLSMDMKSAKVYLSIMSVKDLSQKLYSILDQERYFIQKAAAGSLRIKFCPRLNFFVNHVSLQSPLPGSHEPLAPPLPLKESRPL